MAFNHPFCGWSDFAGPSTAVPQLYHMDSGKCGTTCGMIRRSPNQLPCLSNLDSLLSWILMASWSPTRHIFLVAWIPLNPVESSKFLHTQKAPNPLGSGSAAVDLGGFRGAFGVSLLRFRWRAPENEDRPLPLPVPVAVSCSVGNCPRMTSLQIFANSYGLFHGGGWTWLGHIGSYHLHVIEIKWKCLTRNLLANQIQEDHHPKSGWNVSCLKCYCIV
jgi:hypothetical protein